MGEKRTLIINVENSVATPTPNRNDFLPVLNEIKFLLERGALSGEGKIEVNSDKSPNPEKYSYFFDWAIVAQND
jgi:hypothetical protein